MTTSIPSDEIRAAFHAIVEGRTVKRSKHDLLWHDQDLSEEFILVLRSGGYLPARVREVNVEPGERVPAFFLTDVTAYFGWIFWEKFSPQKLRKLFGSVVRNAKGDWVIQISSHNESLIYVNMGEKTTMDIDRPSSA